MSACEKALKWTRALGLATSVEPDLIGLSGAVSAAGGCSEWQLATLIFRGLQRDSQLGN